MTFTEEFKKGDRVKHHQHGEGTVLRPHLKWVGVGFDRERSGFHRLDGLCEFKDKFSKKVYENVG